LLTRRNQLYSKLLAVPGICSSVAVCLFLVHGLVLAALKV
jgi:hypothetical protein